MDYIDGPHGRLAFEHVEGEGPLVVFLGGFRSDMTGSKAMALQEWAQSRGQAFLRFDYSGHGASEGRFEDGTIGAWLADAKAMIAAHQSGPEVLVGSSMGGWISLLIARAQPERVAGLVTIAAAPDFTQQGFEASFTAAQKAEMAANGQIEVPTDYGPLVLTQKLIDEGRNHHIMANRLDLPMPVRMLQGTADADVPLDWALRLLDHASGEDIDLHIVKGADHSFSDARCLTRLRRTLNHLLADIA